jgi:ketosteroid isomerase-like protein
MTRPTLATSLLALFVSMPATAQEQEKPATVAILEAVKGIGNPFVTRDRKALEALFTADVDLLDADGSFRRGRDAVVEHLLKSRRRQGITPRTGVRLVGRDTALVEGSYRQEGDDREMWAMVVLRWTPDDWKIAAVRIFLPAAPVRLP